MRFFIGFLVTIGLIVLVIVLLVRGGGGTATPSPTALNLNNLANGNTSAHLLIDSPVVAESEHRELEITVDQNQVTYTEYQGYEESVIETQTFANNPASYAVFLHSLQLANFTVGNTSKTLHDERGYCPTGYRYIYSFNNGTKDLTRFWSTSCGSVSGTFKGIGSTVRTLFQNQVPDYAKLSYSFYEDRY